MFAIKDCPTQDDAPDRISVNLSAPAGTRTNPRQQSKTPPSPLRRSEPFAKVSPPRRSQPLAKAGVFNKLRTLLLAQKFQRAYFHPLPHSLKKALNVTPVFPITPTLSLRSCASEPKLTPLLSCACALFRKTTGDRGTGAKDNFSAGRRLHPAIRHEFDVGPIMDSSRLW
jgi:hypothetical protein